MKALMTKNSNVSNAYWRNRKVFEKGINVRNNIRIEVSTTITKKIDADFKPQNFAELLYHCKEVSLTGAEREYNFNYPFDVDMIRKIFLGYLCDIGINPSMFENDLKKMVEVTFELNGIQYNLTTKREKHDSTEELRDKQKLLQS